MRTSIKICTAACGVALLSALPVQASLVSAVGGVSSVGGVPGSGTGPSIIAAPLDATDDAAYNTGIQGFDEVIGYTLGAALSVDGGTIAAGTRVDSHMIFLNSGPGDDGTLIEHGAGLNTNAVTFTFDGLILGVMSDRGGTLEAASSSFLGAAGTTYPGAFGARGMEGGPLDGLFDNDWYATSGMSIRLGMRVTEPGDWIRVVTVSAVPVPASMLLFGTALAGLGGLSARRKRRKS